MGGLDAAECAAFPTMRDNAAEAAFDLRGEGLHSVRFHGYAGGSVSGATVAEFQRLRSLGQGAVRKSTTRSRS